MSEKKVMVERAECLIGTAFVHSTAGSALSVHVYIVNGPYLDSEQRIEWRANSGGEAGEVVEIFSVEANRIEDMEREKLKVADWIRENISRYR